MGLAAFSKHLADDFYTQVCCLREQGIGEVGQCEVIKPKLSEHQG